MYSRHTYVLSRSVGTSLETNKSMTARYSMQPIRLRCGAPAAEFPALATLRRRHYKSEVPSKSGGMGNPMISRIVGITSTTENSTRLISWFRM